VLPHDRTAAPPRPRSMPASLAGDAFLLPAILLVGVDPAARSRNRGELGLSLQLDAEEGFVLNQALVLRRGESIYRPIDRPPFWSAITRRSILRRWDLMHGG